MIAQPFELEPHIGPSCSTLMTKKVRYVFKNKELGLMCFQNIDNVIKKIAGIGTFNALLFTCL